MIGTTQGYTLIELLIVILIISIVTTVALLSMNRNDNKRLEAFANEVAQTITLAEEQAMLQPAILGLAVNDKALQFMAYQPPNHNNDSGTKEQQWVLLEDKALSSRVVPSDIQVKLSVAGVTKSTTTNLVPQVIISTNGDLTPFTLYVGKKDAQPRYIIRGNADGNVITTSATH